MNKQGQLFVIAAIILILVLFTLTIQYNQVREFPAPETFDETSENFANEYSKVYNLALYQEEVPSDKIREFTQEFVEETRETDPNYGVFYVFKDTAGNVHVLNTLNKKVLNIRILDDELRNDEGLSLALASSNTQSGGEVCITGSRGLCSRQRSNAGNFGERNEAVIGDVDTLEINLPGRQSGEFISLIPDQGQSGFTNFIYQTTSSGESIEFGSLESGGREIISVSVTEFR